MNLQSPRGNDATQTSNRSKDVVPGSGLCSRCTDGCRGQLRGLQVLVPRPRGHLPRSVRRGHRRRRQGLPDRLLAPQHPGLCAGRQGSARGRGGQPGQHALPDGDTETEFGIENKVKMKVPIFTGALGSTEIARKNWEHFAVGAAISGVSLVCGENVCGIDPGARARRQRQGHALARHGASRRGLPPLPPGLRRHPRADERRGHPPWRGRVLHREARRRDDGAQVGPGRQVHRRRDQGRHRSSARSSCRGAATSSRPTRATRRSRPRSRTRAIKQFERHSPPRLRR